MLGGRFPANHLILIHDIPEYPQIRSINSRHLDLVMQDQNTDDDGIRDLPHIVSLNPTRLAVYRR